MKYHKRSIDLLPYLGAVAIVLPALSGPLSAAAATIWNGPTITFSKADSADPTLAVNQDQITSNVWLTRGSGAGLYNAKTETFYMHNLSPADTEWSYGQLADYASLTYTNWESMFGGVSGGGPSSTLNKDAVLHLKTDDIYLSIKLMTWSNGHLEPGGGFSYVRSTPGGTQFPPPPPTLRSMTVLGNGSFRFSFADIPGYTFTVLGTTNIELALSNWAVLGSATESPAGTYQFTDSTAPANARRFYMVRQP
jgi:hypothetical protein